MAFSKGIKNGLHRLGEAAIRGGHALYLYHYGVGIHTMRLLRRNGRLLYRLTAPLRQGICALWQHVVVRPVKRFKRRISKLLVAIPAGFRELGASAKAGPRQIVSCFGGLCRRAVHHYRFELGLIWRLVGPAIGAIVLIITLGAWLNTEFCLSLTYHDQRLGYIDNEIVYDNAATMAKGRVMNEDNTFQVDAVANLAITVKGSKGIMDDSDLCNAILGTAGDAIAEATGLYVDNQFVGAMSSRDTLAGLLDTIKDGYYDKADTNQRAEFVQQVQLEDGLYPAGTVIDSDAMQERLTSEAVVKKTYAVQPGDTLSSIAVSNDMTITELRNMNPSFASTDMVHIGDELLIQRPQPFLRVKVIKTIYYTEKIDYKTNTEYDDSKYVTYSQVKQKGVEGSQDVVAEVTYLDGVENSRQVISTNVTKEPVTKVVVKGTKKVVSSSGSVVQQGDGITHGSMTWPVPICHNMSRGYSRGHLAIDICNGPVSVRGKPAVAADGGTVIFAATGYNGGFGNMVKIQHSNGLVTVYAHLQSLKVVRGQSVSRGQTIGLIGSSGRSSGPHLHFEVIRNGVRVNPLNYVQR